MKHQEKTHKQINEILFKEIRELEKNVKENSERLEGLRIALKLINSTDTDSKSPCCGADYKEDLDTDTGTVVKVCRACGKEYKTEEKI